MASQQLQMIVQTLRAGMQRDNPELDVETMRAGLESMTGMFPGADDLALEPVTAGGRPAEWIAAPDASGEQVILYLHGGGYAIGSIDTHRDLVGRLSRASGARGLALDYRLAPEDPHPAAVDDAVAGYRWLLERDLQPSSIAIAGDSAGGGLTAATLVALRDAGDPLPGAAALLSPWTDLALTGDSLDAKAEEDPMVQRDGLSRMAEWYVGGGDPRAPLASPLYADLAGLPPLLIQVGTAETLLDDSTRLAERARDAGVDVTLEPWEEMIHVFQAFAAVLPEGQEAVERIGEFFRKHLT